jgi:Uma2 family endonuclease
MDSVSREALLEPLAGTEISLEEWAAMPEDEPGELVDGRLEEEEVPEFVHEVLVILLGRLLANWILPRGGLVAGSGTKQVVSERRGRKPDVVVYLPGRRPPARGLIRVPPDLAVEIVSPTPRDARRDRVEKVDDYAAFGIRWYWILDPELRSLEILELGADGRYVHAVGATSGVIDPVPGCEGLAVNLDELWGEIDRLAAEAPAASPP